MALFRASPLIGAISGNLGPVNFVVSSTRPVVRQARRRTANQGDALTTSRARLQYLALQWTAMTVNGRAAWATLAATQRWPDRLSQMRQPTGRQFFFSHNLALLLCGQTPDTNTPPVAADTTTWTGIGMNITGSQTAHIDFLQPLFGPYAKAAVYGQTFYRPTPQIITPTLGNILGVVPQKWKFILYQPGINNAGSDLYPAAANIIGPLAVGQRLALKARWIQPGFFSSSTYTTIATRP